MHHIRENKLIQKLIRLQLPPSQYAIFGSGPMFAHNIRNLEDLNDIDIIAIGDAWRKSLRFNNGPVIYDDGWKCEHIYLFNEEIEIWNGWHPASGDIDKLITNAEVIDGIPFIRLEDMVIWKKAMNRQKDKEHLLLVENYLKGHSLNKK
jgi:hypothetical protein